jgi:hypothetical protein
MALIGALDHAAIEQPYGDDDPAQRPVTGKAHRDTCRHYLEHRTWIAAWHLPPDTSNLCALRAFAVKSST